MTPRKARHSDGAAGAARRWLHLLDTERRRAAGASTAALRTVRRTLSRRLREASRNQVLALAQLLIQRDAYGDRFLAYELVAAHPATMASLTPREVRRLGRGLSDWVGVDCFAVYVAGPAWRDGRLPDALIASWTRASDRWWRRAAVVSTVPLNLRARGGTGEVGRTLRIARLARRDRDPMVVKALSWALRELAKRDPEAVRRFLDECRDTLPALVRREVSHKLDTGLKQARRHARGPRTVQPVGPDGVASVSQITTGRARASST